VYCLLLLLVFLSISAYAQADDRIFNAAMLQSGQPPMYTTVKVTIQAIDGFGAVRSEWLVVIENVASGMGQVDAELVEGQQYVARVTGLGFTNTTTFVAKGPQMVIRLKYQPLK
jgi:hypothetical protein